MNCANIQKSLSAYLDREMAAWEKAPIAMHLDDCSSCQQELQDLLSLKGELRTYSLPSMPPDLKEMIEAETWGRRSAASSLWQARWWAPTIVLAAAASWFFLRATKAERQPMTPPQMVEAPEVQEKLIAKGPLVAVRGKEF